MSDHAHTPRTTALRTHRFVLEVAYPTSNTPHHPGPTRQAQPAPPHCYEQRGSTYRQEGTYAAVAVSEPTMTPTVGRKSSTPGRTHPRTATDSISTTRLPHLTRLSGSHLRARSDTGPRIRPCSPWSPLVICQIMRTHRTQPRLNGNQSRRFSLHTVRLFGFSLRDVGTARHQAPQTWPPPSV